MMTRKQLEDEKMTETEAVAKLDALDPDDSEVSHIEADKVLLEFLKTNGFSEIAKAWDRAADRIDFWYA